MDTREFKANDYTFKVKLHTGPGPYLIHLANGREALAESGEYLIYEGDKIVGFLPAHIVDMMALGVEEIVTLERTRQVGDNREVSEFHEITVGAGERFDGVRVLDADGRPVERDLKEVRKVLRPSSDDLRADGEPKDVEDLKADQLSKEDAIAHPVNRFNEASGRAAKEVAELAKSRVANEETAEAGDGDGTIAERMSESDRSEEERRKVAEAEEARKRRQRDGLSEYAPSAGTTAENEEDRKRREAEEAMFTGGTRNAPPNPAPDDLSAYDGR